MDMLIEMLLHFQILFLCILFQFYSQQPLSEISCKRSDVRQLSALSKLSLCTVIEGDLFIVFTKIPRETRLSNLREITGSLLIYDVTGPESLSSLFPNLTVVRGQSLVHNYAIIIKGTSLKNIGLASLRLVQRGGIRVDSNPHLCYSKTVNWDTILASTHEDYLASVKFLKNGLLCSDACPTTCSLPDKHNKDEQTQKDLTDAVSEQSQSFCWSASECQSICSTNCSSRGLACHMQDWDKCCHPECLAGCYGDGSHMCVACKHVMHMNHCLPKCPLGTYEYLNRRCVTEIGCLIELPKLSLSSTPYMSLSTDATMIHTHIMITDDVTKLEANTFALFNESCVPKCPEGYKKSYETGRCERCGIKCERKYCREFLIYSLKDVTALEGCYSAKAIYISLQEGQPEIVAQHLETAFQRLKYVLHSLRVVRSPVITSLNFMRNLKVIGLQNQNTSSHLIAFEISGNDNLRELWTSSNQSTGDETSGLKILSDGLVRISQNRRLCPDTIFRLLESGALQLPGRQPALTQVEKDLMIITNGDLAHCNWIKFDLALTNLGPYSVHLSWPLASSLRFPDSNYSSEQSLTSTDSKENNGSPNNSNHHSIPKRDELVLTFLFYQPAPMNLSARNDLDPHDSKSWRMLTAPCSQSDPLPSNTTSQNDQCHFIVSDLEPASRYAVFVEMKFPLRHSGAISNVIYFTTLSINPSPPQFVWLSSLDENKLRLTWMPPAKPSGELGYHLIWFRSLKPRIADYLERDFCFEKPKWVKSWDVTRTYSPMHLTLKHAGQLQSTNDACSSCSSCPRLDEIESLMNPLIRSSDGMSWPGSVSRWMVDNNGRSPHIEIFHSDQSQSRWTLSNDRIGLIIKPHTKGSQSNWWSQGRSNNSQCVRADSEMEQLIYGFQPFTEVIVELQSCLKSTNLNHPNSSDCQTMAPWEYLQPGSIVNPYDNLTEWSVCESILCSSRMTVLGRVKSRESADNIPRSSIQTIAAGPGSFHILWSEPPTPNGVILHYMLRYRLEPGFNRSIARSVQSQPKEILNSPNETVPFASSTSSIWLTKCISRRQWISYNIDQLKSVPSHNRNISNTIQAIPDKPYQSPRTKRDVTSSTINQGGVVLSDLPAGLYAFQIAAVSLAGIGKWSEIQGFYVASYPESQSDFRQNKSILIIGLVSALVFLIFCSCVGLIIYKVRSFYLKATAWTSTNPEYWTIYEVDAWEMDRDDIDVLGWKLPLGHGSFGTVYRGMVRQLRTPARLFYADPKNIPVAIKTLNMTCTLFDRRDFINEACYMKQFQSFHLVRLLGLVSKTAPTRKPGTYFQHVLRSLKQGSFWPTRWNKSRPIVYRRKLHQNDRPSIDVDDNSGKVVGTKDESQKLNDISDCTTMIHNPPPIDLQRVSPDSPLVVMEFMAKGDLASYLRHLGDIGQGCVQPSQAYLWATQIADGMAYLSAKRYVHRDLAARNCLVDAHLVVKIGDFGLCRDIYERNYYHKLGRGRLPIRWMAPESLKTAYFTCQSDIWSYGVVLWEIATMACLPYRGMSHTEVIQYVLEGNTLVTNGFPTNCPELFPALMLHCWNYNPHKRPTFLGLSALLSPRFGDVEFRLASFFYVGERYLDSSTGKSPLEAPAITLGRINERCGQDPARELACALSVVLAQADQNSLNESIDDDDVDDDTDDSIPTEFTAPIMEPCPNSDKPDQVAFYHNPVVDIVPENSKTAENDLDNDSEAVAVQWKRSTKELTLADVRHLLRWRNIDEVEDTLVIGPVSIASGESRLIGPNAQTVFSDGGGHFGGTGVMHQVSTQQHTIPELQIKNSNNQKSISSDDISLLDTIHVENKESGINS